MKQALGKHHQSRKLTTLVENRSTYSAEYAELNIFETHQFAENVELQFGFPIIAIMLTGKKIMHLDGMKEFDFYPGESVVLPSDKKMIIDFPLAKKNDPTQCLALGIDPDKIADVVNKFNQYTAIEEENNNWTLDETSSHLTNNEEVNHLIDRLVHTFLNSNSSKDILLDLMIQELIVRLLQTKAKYHLLSDQLGIFNDSRIGIVLKYIKEHLTDKNMSIETLAKKACMSSSHFYRKFKNTLGTSPIDYINGEKIKFAKRLMKERRNLQISEVAFLSGFNNVSYFIRQFKKIELITPQQFKKSIDTPDASEILKFRNRSA
ncbi:AraC family transcriptional regulator [Flavilitoribacter nigricans]|uniref:AraC family transcriptional regulator n=1 Tax=Flavilitoribacter nigricans (strain ATCC 23147 / DSM 23189 / NBRC 102662 / NCIMB 1420 / SS-2) TaxID=1122177 RepID=A0A2D0NIX8_FLAN2|nr:AraC family transcriptional regulator [Flavilitoribacter nigricans]PHN08454.1 AraC family transcriptional regulator [Flavilitoribacter nigricans DSM 23189 = NBRC 102662]